MSTGLINFSNLLPSRDRPSKSNLILTQRIARQQNNYFKNNTLGNFSYDSFDKSECKK